MRASCAEFARSPEALSASTSVSAGELGLPEPDGNRHDLRGKRDASKRIAAATASG
jgi:hypothetical protein